MNGEPPFRPGDVVHHGPSGEDWVVAYADPASGYMSWCGWPEGEALISDCTLVRRALPDRSNNLRSDLIQIGGRRGATVARLYSDGLAPAPCDEPRHGGDGLPAPGRSPAGAVPEGQAPDPSTLQAEIARLSTALAESERKRVEAEHAAIELARAAYGVDATAPSEAQMERLHIRAGRVFASTPTQETNHVEG